MYLASEAYKQLHNISSVELLEDDDKFGIFSYIADSFDVLIGWQSLKWQIFSKENWYSK